MKRSDRMHLWINVLFLAFIPFSAALLGQYPRNQIALVFYGANLVAVGLALYLHWWYATSDHRLVDEDIDPLLVLSVRRKIFTGFFVYLLSIVLAFFSPTLSLVIYVLLPVLYILPSRIDRFWSPCRGDLYPLS